MEDGRSGRRTKMTDHALLTPEEAAAYLRVTPQTVYRLVRAGKLPGVKVGHLWRLRRVDLEAHLAGGGPAPKQGVGGGPAPKQGVGGGPAPKQGVGGGPAP